VLILKGVKVLCFDTLLQVLILNGLFGMPFASLDPNQEYGGASRGLLRTGWGVNFISYDSAKWPCCQVQYIVSELLVRTDWELVGGAGVTGYKHVTRSVGSARAQNHPCSALSTPTDRCQLTAGKPLWQPSGAIGSTHRLGAIAGIDADILRGEIAGPVTGARIACVQVHYDGHMVR